MQLAKDILIAVAVTAVAFPIVINLIGILFVIADEKERAYPLLGVGDMDNNGASRPAGAPQSLPDQPRIEAPQRVGMALVRDEARARDSQADRPSVEAANPARAAA